MVVYVSDSLVWLWELPSGNGKLLLVGVPVCLVIAAGLAFGG